MTPYAELHMHSGYSFLDGASHPEELVAAGERLGYGAMALTDHDGLYGSMEFAREARRRGIRAITGAEVTVRYRREDGADGIGHLTLLAETPEGYANLCRHLTTAHRMGPRRSPALPLDLLLERNEGLILLTGCGRSPFRHALEDSEGAGEACARRFREAFGADRLFVELQDNLVQGDLRHLRQAARVADRLGIGVVATGNVHYHRRERHRLQDLLVAIRHRTTLDAAHPHRRPNSEFHLRSPDEMEHRFATRPDAIANTVRIAERCAAFDLTRDLGYAFPDFEGGEGRSAMELLGEVTRSALAERYEGKKRAAAEERLDKELELVARHGLGGFFLVYRDIMELAREVACRVRGESPRSRAGLPPGRGRGSSVSSIICYLIGLSHVDPVEADLFLGRFLNDAVGSVPDIDLDFPREIREELILAVHRKYGHDHTGMVAIFPTYRTRSAVREVGMALDLPPGDLERIAKLADHRSIEGLKEDFLRIPEWREKIDRPPWTHFLEGVAEIHRFPRHISQHVGGMIISSRPLLEVVPLEPAAMEGRFLCQWDKDSCDDARFIKIDFLSLGMLSLVEEAVDLIAARGTAERGPAPVVGGAPDLSRIDLDDREVYRRIQAGDTVGVFQVESRAQIQMLRRTLPSSLAELAVQVAIVRPGPIVGGAVNPYVRRREAQRADPDYPIPHEHPLLEGALAETLGVIIYQDQVLRVCRDFAGFSDGEAESLRRAMSRKRSEEAMEEHRHIFVKGAMKRGVEEDLANRIFLQVSAFSAFGFPKSHAFAFALLAFQSAWLRHHFPTEYYVALFNNQPMGFYSLDVLGRDARRNGVEVLPPDVNRSGVRCTAEGEDLRVGLSFVREWGEEVAAQVVEERERNGLFHTPEDFLARTPAALRRPAVESLLWVGGMDGMGLTRRELLWRVGLRLGPAEERGRAEGRADGAQLSLALSEPEEERIFRDLDERERVVADYRALRFSTGLHPLALVREELPSHFVSSGALPSLSQGTEVTVAGSVVARQRPQTASGYVFILLEDEEGTVNVVVKPKIYERDRVAIRTEPLLVVRGRLQKEGATLNVIAQEVLALPREGREETRGYLTDLRASPAAAKHFG